MPKLTETYAKKLPHSFEGTQKYWDNEIKGLRRSTSFVGWRKRKSLIKDLNIQLDMIAEKIAPEEPTEAFDLLWQFIELAPSVYERVDDSRGDVGDVFREALLRFEDIGPYAVLDPTTLAWAQSRLAAVQKELGVHGCLNVGSSHRKATEVSGLDGF